MSPTISIPGSLDMHEADWSAQTPDASPCSWYDFFVPNCVQQMLKRRIAQFEIAKLLSQLVCSRDEASLRIVVDKLTEDLEVMRVPALQSEAHGRPAIEALRAHLLQSISVSSMRIVDIYHGDTEGRVLNIRGVVTGQQTRPLFPNLPVGKDDSYGISLSIEMNDAWRPKSSCWEFIPLEPLLDIAGMQDLMNSPPPSTRVPSGTSSPSFSASSSTDVVCKANDFDTIPPMSMEEQHARGTCTPCSFFAFKTDGCRQGEACTFCHLCSAKEAKVRRKQQRKAAKTAASLL